MSIPILHTKLYIPPLGGRMVARSRLVARILGGLDGKLTLISAPAGFGKTTLLSEFAARCPHPVAWLSLDAADNDPIHFLSYLIAALRSVEPGLGEGLSSAYQAGYPGRSEPLESALAQLLNEIGGLKRRLVLVLDDLHALQAAPIHQALVFLLEHLPPNLHLIVASRADPPWPLARQRARAEMVELRAADLRFTPQEADHFLLEKMDLPLQPGQVQALEARTEGWPAGLQLAAVALRSAGQSQPPAGFVTGFTGSHRYIADYLTDEVLRRQAEPVQRFLLHTALLSRMNAPLCAAVLAQANGLDHWSIEDCQQMLEQLENANLFVVPLDEQRHWYRYHHLFADLLRHRLQQKSPERLPALHRAAADWYASQAESLHDPALVEEALQHSQAAGDPAALAALLDSFGDIFWQQGELSRLRQWIERLPAEVLAGHANLNILYAWMLVVGGDYAQAGAVLARAEQILAQPTPSQPPTPDLRGKLATVQAFQATFSGNFPAIIPAARQALEYLSGSQSTWRTLAGSALGDALSLAGDSRAALQAFREASASSRPAENPYLALNAGVKLVMALRQTGQLEPALQTLRQQLEIAEATGLRKTAMAGLLLALQGDILCEWGAVQEGLALAEQGAQICEQGSHIGYLGWSQLTLARVRASAGDLAGVDQVMQRLDALQPNLPPWLVSPLEGLRGLLWLARADFARLEAWVQQRGLHPQDERMRLRAFEYLAYARFLLARQQPEAAEVLERLRQQTTAAGLVDPALDVLIIETQRREQMGDRPGAVQALESALRLGQPGGYLQTFVDEASGLWPVLQAISPARVDADYLARLLEACRQALPAQAAPPEPGGLLSTRELEVLRLMSAGHPNREIADRLHISLNTVLFHSKNIFSKLNTSSRTQAVARAREAGLL